MAKPKPTKAELANCSAKLYGVAALPVLKSWGDLASCQRPSTVSGLIQLADLSSACRDASLGSIHSAALPFVVAGHNVNVTSMNRIGVVSCCAVAAISAVNTGEASTQVIIFGQSQGYLDQIHSQIKKISTDAKANITCGYIATGGSGQILLGLAHQASNVKGAAPRLVIVVEVDDICSSPEEYDTAIAEVVKANGSQNLLFCGECLSGWEGAEADPTAKRIRLFETKVVGNQFVQIEDGLDLINFITKNNMKADIRKLGRIGVYDVNTLKMADPQALQAAVGNDPSMRIAAALERQERQLMQAGGWQVPPFDIASGQWEWTPDNVDKWKDKGLDPKYYHTEPDGASQSIMAGNMQAAPWDLNPDVMPEGVDDGYEEEDEADAAWAEMFGGEGGGGQQYSNGAFGMGNLEASLPDGEGLDLIAVLGPELGQFVGSLALDPQQAVVLVDALQNAGINHVSQLHDIRWSLTTALGIDYAIASAIGQGLS